MRLTVKNRDAVIRDPSDNTVDLAVMGQWYAIHRKTKQPSPPAAAFKAFLVAHGAARLQPPRPGPRAATARRDDELVIRTHPLDEGD